MKFPVKISLDDNGEYLVTFPDIPEAVTSGESKELAMGNAIDALESALDFYFDDKRLIPIPGDLKKEQPFVTLPGTVSAKALLHNEILAKGIKKAELARRMNMAPPNIERIFQAKHGTRFETLEAAFQALGKSLEISVR